MDKEMIQPCHVTELISGFIDGELSHKEKQLVDQHLKDCDICRTEYDALRSLNNLLCDIKPIAPSTDFSQRFWKALDAREAKKTPWAIFKDFTWGWRPSLVSAAAALLIVAGSFMFYRSVTPVLDPPIHPTDQVIAHNMALYRDYEIINNLELFENWEEIMNLEEQIN